MPRRWWHRTQNGVGPVIFSLGLLRSQRALVEGESNEFNISHWLIVIFLLNRVIHLVLRAIDRTVPRRHQEHIGPRCPQAPRCGAGVAPAASAAGASAQI